MNEHRDREICEAYRRGRAGRPRTSMAEVGRRFGLSASQVGRIWRRDVVKTFGRTVADQREVARILR